MKRPPWLLKIIFSYLSNRTLISKFKEAIAEPRKLMQEVLGKIIFLVKFNGAMLKPQIQRNVSLMLVKFLVDATGA